MESGGSSYETAIDIPESKRTNGKGKAAAVGAPATFTATPQKGGWKKYVLHRLHCKTLCGGPRLLLLICDVVTMALTIASAAAAASVVYLIDNGSSDANWLPICQAFGDFCQSTSEAGVASLIASSLFMFLIVLSISSVRLN